jgi:hypothetical protein
VVVSVDDDDASGGPLVQADAAVLAGTDRELATDGLRGDES